MNVDTLYPIVCRWYDTGVLSDSDKPEVIAAYNEITGLNFTGTCKKCQWSDVQHALRYHLIKVLNLPSMSSANKYMILASLAYLSVHGLPYVYINKGTHQESDSAKFLTDEIAEELLKKEGMDEVIVLNPEYDAEAKPATPAAKPSTPKAPKAPTDPSALTPQQKSAATKKAKQDAIDATKKAEFDAAEAKAKADAEEAAKLNQGTGTNE